MEPAVGRDAGYALRFGPLCEVHTITIALYSALSSSIGSEGVGTPRRTRTLEGLSQELTATKTTDADPEIDLTFAYSVKEL